MAPQRAKFPDPVLARQCVACFKQQIPSYKIAKEILHRDLSTINTYHQAYLKGDLDIYDLDKERMKHSRKMEYFTFTSPPTKARLMGGR